MYVIINKTGKFHVGIREWNRKPVLEKTWLNFNEHFHVAHKELRETVDLTLRDTTFKQANLVQQVVEGI